MDVRLGRWPQYSEEEARIVSSVLSSGRVNYWTGEEGKLFEREFAEKIGGRYAVAVMNGTVALEIALRSVGIGRGDEVIVSPRTFIASASAIVAVGATPVFVDVDLNSQNITADNIKRAITNNTRAVIVVHLAGFPCDMREILEVADSNNVAVIEDCAQSHGAKIGGQYVGTFGHVSAWSFCQDKIMTTGGEGGMVVTNCQDIYERAWSYKDHGKSVRLINGGQVTSGGGGFKWVHESFGSNARMTELQAALGRYQLTRLDEWVRVRNKNASILEEELFGLKEVLQFPNVPSSYVHAYYRLYVLVNQCHLAPGWDRDRLLSEMRERGVPVFVGSCSEVYRESAFLSTHYRVVGDMKNARYLAESSLAFLVHPSMTEEDMRWIGRTARDVLENAIRG